MFFICFYLFIFIFFFFNDTATTEIYTTVHTLSLHDALPTCWYRQRNASRESSQSRYGSSIRSEEHTSELQSRTVISYAVFCLKKKKLKTTENICLYVTMRGKTSAIDISS